MGLAHNANEVKSVTSKKACRAISFNKHSRELAKIQMTFVDLIIITKTERNRFFKVTEINYKILM